MAAKLDATSSSVAHWQELPVAPALVQTLQTRLEDKGAVGRWGERFVFEHLRLSLPAARVEWINADTETGLPYDLTISSVGAERVFVEVKTSSARSKPFFEVSLAELDCARQNGGNYVIYRVTGAGSEHVRLACLPNPVGCLTVGGFTLQLSEVGTQAVR